MYLVWRRIECALVIVAQRFQRRLHIIAGFDERRHWFGELAIFPVDLAVN